MDVLFFESECPIENIASFRLNMYGASYYVGKLASRFLNSAATLMANPYDALITESEKASEQVLQVRIITNTMCFIWQMLIMKDIIYQIVPTVYLTICSNVTPLFGH